jgi:hypothetical protein
MIQLGMTILISGFLAVSVAGSGILQTYQEFVSAVRDRRFEALIPLTASDSPLRDTLSNPNRRHLIQTVTPTDLRIIDVQHHGDSEAVIRVTGHLTNKAHKGLILLKREADQWLIHSTQWSLNTFPIYPDPRPVTRWSATHSHVFALDHLDVEGHHVSFRMNEHTGSLSARHHSSQNHFGRSRLTITLFDSEHNPIAIENSICAQSNPERGYGSVEFWTTDIDAESITHVKRFSLTITPCRPSKLSPQSVINAQSQNTAPDKHQMAPPNP